MHNDTILVTGGAGFIGSNFIQHHLASGRSCRIINLDKLTYAGNPSNLEGMSRDRTLHLHPWRYLRPRRCEGIVVGATPSGHPPLRC